MAGIAGDELIIQVARRCNITPDAGRFTTTNILAVINYIQSDIVLETKCLMGRSSFTTTAGQNVISLSLDDDNDSLDILDVDRVTLDKTRLERRTKAWLDANIPLWDTDDSAQGEPHIYYPVDGIEGIGLYRIPDAAYTVRVEFVKEPTDITNAATSYPFNNVTQLHPYHNTIIPGAAWKLMQGMPEKKQSLKDEQALQYINETKQIKDRLNTPIDRQNISFKLKTQPFQSNEGNNGMSIRYDNNG